MPTVSLEDVTPPARYDDLPWMVLRVEEAELETGTWEEIDTFDLDPIDTDPSDPLPRSVTTEEAALTGGWYRVIFVDADGDESNATTPLHNVETVFGELRPPVRSLGALLRARTLDNNGNELGTFTANTRPTADQASDILNQATSTVIGQVGDNIPEDLWELGRQVILYFAAFNVEISYYPEQANQDQSAADHYWTMYETLLVSFKEALKDNQGGGTTFRAYSIPILGRKGRRVYDDFEDDLPFSA